MLSSAFWLSKGYNYPYFGLVWPVLACPNLVWPILT